jgi:hypothetical protein
MAIQQGFIDALVSSGPAQELADADDLFGFLIGSWDIDAILHNADGETQKTQGEVHASWVLEGRAIQDLFIFPRRADRAVGTPARRDRYATTIRTYDRTRQVWKVNFVNPADDETSARLIARRRESMIEMEGRLFGGTPVRWRYDSVTPTSFHYRADKLMNHAGQWRTHLEIFGARMATV